MCRCIIVRVCRIYNVLWAFKVLKQNNITKKGEYTYLNHKHKLILLINDSEKQRHMAFRDLVSFNSGL